METSAISHNFPQFPTLKNGISMAFPWPFPIEIFQAKVALEKKAQVPPVHRRKIIGERGNHRWVNDSNVGFIRFYMV